MATVNEFPKIPKQMRHLNRNVLCALSIKTTGPIAGHDDIIQIAVLVVDAFLRPAEQIMPFYFDVKPLRPENIEVPKAAKYARISRSKLLDIMNRGYDPFLTADALDEWFENLSLSFRKRLVPIVYDWPSVKPFLQKWLLPETFKSIFSSSARDVLANANYDNDRSNWLGELAPYPKQNFSYLCSQMNIYRTRKEDCLETCAVLIELYKRMLITRY